MIVTLRTEILQMINHKMKKLSFILALFFMTFGVSAQVDSPLTLEAIESGIITFTNKAWFPVSYCIDGGATQTIDAEQQKEIVVSSGQKVTFFGDNPEYSDGNYNSSNIRGSSPFYAYGNVMSLVNSKRISAACHYNN